ncbi:hypothetical protein J5A73_06570 [Leptotrichia sp. oral taxon 218]|uniref:hypothetical protein n=1 Tax=Leptotrichia sp. oral taxon 218 TaxID=712361 RepID=UPI001B8CA0FD|nr:hypothetical protein [Leptotrichia sp. oral taxon 218]QUB94719.1 hypothetical protein J5A73_06570 [Leptotrichia sp. oral taxon 218]
MEKNKISRIELAREIRKLFVKNRNIQEYSKIDDNFLVDYYFNRYDERNNKSGMKIDENNFNLKIFEEDFKNHLSNEKKLLEEEGVDTSEITKIVSAFSHSYSENSILEELPFEKDLRIFPNIKTLYLLYTDQTESKFLEYKESSKYRDKIEIEGILIENSIEMLYKEIVKLIQDGKISKNNTVLDTTLGFKEIGIVFYRISVEKQIKSINWRETMLPNYKPVDDNKNEFIKGKGQGPRMSLVTKLNLMKEPLEESNRIYRKINENILKVNCKAVSDLYEVVGIDDLRFFYEEIGKLFNFFKMLEYNEDIENFYSDLNEALKKIFKYKFLSENISRLREYVKYLARVIYRVESDYIDIKWLKFSNNIFGITENEIKKEKDEKIEIGAVGKKLDDDEIKKIRESDKSLKNIDFNSNKNDEDENDQGLEKNIDMVDYFLYLLLKQAIFEKISNYHLKSILEEYYEEEMIQEIIGVRDSVDISEDEKIKLIKNILFEEFTEEYELEELEIPDLADKNVGLLKYKGGILDIPFEDEGKLEILKINFKEEYFIRKRDKRQEFDISKVENRIKLNKKIEIKMKLEEILDKNNKDEINFPFKISEKSDIVEIQNGKIVTKSDRKTKVKNIFFNNSDSIINVPIVELFKNIEKNKFEISKKDLEYKFGIKDQKVTKVKDIIFGINQIIRRKIEEKYPKKDDIEDFIIYENGLKINLKYR